MLSFVISGSPIVAVFFAGLFIFMLIWIPFHFLIEAFIQDPNKRNK